MSARRTGDHVVTRRDGERAQHIPHLVFVRQLGIVALVPGCHHMDHGTEDEDEDRRQQDREPQRGEPNHYDLLWLGGAARRKVWAEAPTAQEGSLEKEPARKRGRREHDQYDEPGLDLTDARKGKRRGRGDSSRRLSRGRRRHAADRCRSTARPPRPKGCRPRTRGGGHRRSERRAGRGYAPRRRRAPGEGRAGEGWRSTNEARG